MLRVSKSEVEVKGYVVDILAEFSVLAKHLIDSKIVTKEDLEESLRLATMTSEELDARLTEDIESFIKKIQETTCAKEKDEMLATLMRLMFPRL